MSVAVRMLSAVTIPPLYRLGERSTRLRGRRVRGGILAAMEWLSRSAADAAREALENCDDGPEYLEPVVLAQMIDRYSSRSTRADRRLPHQKAHTRAKEVLKTVSRIINAGSARFLDLACGDGLVAQALQNCGCDVTACDVTPERYKAFDVPFARADAASLGIFPSDTFDVIYSFDAFEHFTDPAAVLCEAHRILRPGGVLYASFGPLYHSPHGGHQFLSLDVPYCHLLFRREDLDAAADCLGKPRLTKNLNYWSLTQFRRLFDEQAERFKTLSRFEKFNVAHVDLVRRYPSCFRARVGDRFDELIVRSMETLLQKKGSP
jgi:SAM-dependent methyltransferase